MWSSWLRRDSIDDLMAEIEEQKKKVEEIQDHYLRMDEEQRLRELENRLRLERQGRP